MKTVFVDVDTQFDFMLPAGALYVPGAEALLPGISALNRWAATRRIPVISTTDAHSESDLEFQTWPAHCVLGTHGQRKPEGTLLAGHAIVPSSPHTLQGTDAPQFIVQKQQLDCFSNPNLPTLLHNLGADRYVVYGVVTEYCVRCAALGLLKSGARVHLVSDAIKTLREEDGERTLNEILALGGGLTTVAQICG